MDRIREFFRREDKLAKYLGIELLEVTPGGAKVRMPIREHHLNGVRTVHGGAIFSLADFAFAAASNSHGDVSVAIQTSVTFIKAAAAGTLTAEAKETSRNPKLGTYQVDVRDDQGDLIASFQGLAYRKKDKLETFMKQ
jgi:acyl-CoA thioesterase